MTRVIAAAMVVLIAFVIWTLCESEPQTTAKQPLQKPPSKLATEPDAQENWVETIESTPFGAILGEQQPIASEQPTSMVIKGAIVRGDQKLSGLKVLVRGKTTSASQSSGPGSESQLSI